LFRLPPYLTSLLPKDTPLPPAQHYRDKRENINFRADVSSITCNKVFCNQDNFPTHFRKIHKKNCLVY